MNSWFEVEPARVVVARQSTVTLVRGFNALIIQHNSIVGELHESGLLELYPGFRWDGASGPAIDTPQNLRPSLFHDALYQLMEQGRIPTAVRRAVDLTFYGQLQPIKPATLADFFLFAPRHIRALYHYVAVRFFGALWLQRKPT